jgi:CBS domain-containing protein
MNAKQVKEVMTPNPETLPSQSSIAEAARIMRERNIGDVLIERDGEICGIVTDRDIVVRGVAEGLDTERTVVEDICSHEIVRVSPNDTIDNAVELMRKKAVRRIPVMDNGKAVGIVSIGDLAQVRDPNSALGNISAAPPNR